MVSAHNTQRGDADIDIISSGIIACQRVSSQPPSEIMSMESDKNDSSASSDPVVRLLLPRLITASAPKRPGQPAGLTLAKSNQRGGGVAILSVSPNSPFFRSFEARAAAAAAAAVAGGIVDIDIDIEDRSSSRPGGNDLRPDDEVLLINSHRVRNPKLAAQMIKNTTSGRLTVVASRGRRTDGMSHCLAKISNDNNCRRSAAAGGGEGGRGELEGWGFHGLRCRSTNDGLLTRISRLSRDGGGPFAKIGLEIGDVILSVDGRVVRRADDVRRLLLGIVNPNEDGVCGSSSGIRVVALLVYSMWDLRRRVLRETLGLGGKGDKWWISYSYEWKSSSSSNYHEDAGEGGDNDRGEEEYAVLRLPDTTVTFRLDFDVDGTCSCREPFESLKSSPSAEDRPRWQGGCNEEEDDSCDDFKSRYSHHEARATLELLYKEHIVPVIDSLNYHTLRQMRLLAHALAASDDNTAGVIAKENRGAEHTTTDRCDTRPTPTPGKATVAFPTDSLLSSDRSGDSSCKRRRPILPSHVPPLFVEDPGEKVAVPVPNRPGVLIKSTLTNPASSSNKTDSISSEGSTLTDSIISTKGSQPPRSMIKDHDDFAEKLDIQRRQIINSTMINPAMVYHSTNRQRISHRQTINDLIYDDSPELNPNRVINRSSSPPERVKSNDIARCQLGIHHQLAIGFPGKSLYDEARQITPIDEVQKEMSWTGVHPTQEICVPQLLDNFDDNVSAISMPAFIRAERPNRRHPAQLRRRPSIVPMDSWKQSRKSQSSLTDSDAVSSTSTTTSSDSDSESSGSGSSGDDENGEAQPQSHAERSLKPTREHSNSTEMVVYNSEIALAGRNVSPAPAPTNQQPLTRRLKMRIGDIRKTYKVSYHIIGSGAFGTVRSCVHRSTREKYAVKSISKKGNVKNAILLKNEIALVQRVNHRHVVKVVDVIQDLEYIHIVMEECMGGDLFDKIVKHGIKLTEERAGEIIGSLLDAIAYLHDRDIVHRDLKVIFVTRNLVIPSFCSSLVTSYFPSWTFFMSPSARTHNAI